MKLNEVNKKYQDEAIVDKENNVLCPICLKEKVWISVISL